MTRLYALRHQPIKGVYLTGQLLLTALVRLPVWVLISLPVRVYMFDPIACWRIDPHHRSWRPRPSWTLKQCIRIKLIRFLTYLGDQCVAEAWRAY